MEHERSTLGLKCARMRVRSLSISHRVLGSDFRLIGLLSGNLLIHDDIDQNSGDFGQELRPYDRDVGQVLLREGLAGTLRALSTPENARSLSSANTHTHTHTPHAGTDAPHFSKRTFVMFPSANEQKAFCASL
eukprot:1718281-Amphidinium_carterae.1